jgi:hypothetical protein
MEAGLNNDEDKWKLGSDNMQNPFLEQTIVDNNEAPLKSERENKYVIRAPPICNSLL